MDAVDAARKIAENVHRTAVDQGANPWRLLEFVLGEAAKRNIVVYALPPDDPQLKGRPGRLRQPSASDFVCGGGHRLRPGISDRA
jgi:hypothetical protein